MVYLEITLNIEATNRVAAAGIYTKFKQPFLSKINGARSKELLVRDEDVQVLHASTVRIMRRHTSAVNFSTTTSWQV